MLPLSKRVFGQRPKNAVLRVTLPPGRLGSIRKISGSWKICPYSPKTKYVQLVQNMSRQFVQRAQNNFGQPKIYLEMHYILLIFFPQNLVIKLITYHYNNNHNHNAISVIIILHVIGKKSIFY